MHYKTAPSWTRKARRAGVLTTRWKPRAKDRWGRLVPGLNRAPMSCSSWQEGQPPRDTGGHRAEAAVVTPPRAEKYLRTHADGVWTSWLFPRR